MTRTMAAAGLSDSDGDEFERKTRSLLHEAKPDCLGSISKQLASQCHAPKDMKHLARVLLSHALVRPDLHGVLAELVPLLGGLLPEFPAEAGGEGPVTFPRLLLNTCQDEFESLLSSHEPADSLLAGVSLVVNCANLLPDDKCGAGAALVRCTAAVSGSDLGTFEVPAGAPLGEALGARVRARLGGGLRVRVVLTSEDGQVLWREDRRGLLNALMSYLGQLCVCKVMAMKVLPMILDDLLGAGGPAEHAAERAQELLDAAGSVLGRTKEGQKLRVRFVRRMTRGRGAPPSRAREARHVNARGFACPPQ